MSMLNDVIIDADALKESAVKRAEAVLIEKYSGDIKKTVETILEQLGGDNLDIPEPEEEDLGLADATLDAEVPAEPAPDIAPEVKPGIFNGEGGNPGEDEEIEIDFSDLKKAMRGQEQIDSTLDLPASTTDDQQPQEEVPGEVNGDIPAAKPTPVPGETEDDVLEEQTVTPELSEEKKGKPANQVVTEAKKKYSDGYIAYTKDTDNGKPVIWGDGDTPEAAKDDAMVIIRQVIRQGGSFDINTEIKALQTAKATGEVREEVNRIGGNTDVWKHEGLSWKIVKGVATVVHGMKEESSMSSGAVEGAPSQDTEYEIDESMLNELDDGSEDTEDTDTITEATTVVVDHEAQPAGTPVGTADAHFEEEAEKNVIQATQDTKFQEELKDTKKQLEKVVSENKILYTSKEKLISENKVLVDNQKKLANRILEMNLNNAKLLYSNKVLSNSSLNERQKKTLTEAIASARNLEEAKATFNSLKRLAEVGSSSRSTKTLTEAVTRDGVISFPSKREEADPAKDRMQVLAGIKKKD